MNGNDSEFGRIQQRFAIAGAAALLLCLAGAFFQPAQFFRSYLLSFVFWTGIGIGCMAILMLHHLVGGNWGFGIRRCLEAAAGNFPLMAVLFLPVLIGLLKFDLYSWSDWKAADHPYLNKPFFIVRSAIYFAAWITLAHFLEKWSVEQDRTADPALTSRLQNLSGPGLLIYGLTVTYMSVDWVMSLEPEWFSTIYGMIFMVTEAVAAMAFVTVMVMLLADRPPLAGFVTPLLLNDYGNLLFTFTMLWAYLSFSQYLIIWSGNLQDEIPWYMVRANGGWAWVALFLLIFHFFVPFLLLLSRFMKRKIRVLGAIALGLVLVSFVDLFWLLTPAFEKAGPQFHWMDWVAALGIGCLWLAGFVSRLKSRPLMPLHDPRCEVVLEHGA